MKIVVDEEGCIPLILGQSMAEVTTSLGIEQFPTAFGRVADGVCTSRDEMVERRIERSQRPFVGCNSAQHILLVHTPAESLHELGLIILVAGDPGNSIPDAGRAHLERVSDRQYRLLLQRTDPTVPKLMFVIEGIQNGWGVALTDAAVDADRHGPAVAEGARRIVAGGAGDRAITREPRLEEQLLTQCNSGRPKRGRRDDILGQDRGKADLI